MYPILIEVLNDDMSCDCDPCPDRHCDTCPEPKKCPPPKECEKCSPAKTVTKRTPCNCEKDCGGAGRMARSNTQAVARSTLPIGYMDSQLYPLKEFWSVYHNLLPQEAAAYRAYEANDYALFIDRDLGGWNNIRMAFEVQVSLAYKYRRKFVLPIKRRFYLVENAGAIDMFTYWDKEHFMKVIPSVDPLDPSDPRVFKVPKEYDILHDPAHRRSLDTLPSDKDWFFPESTRMFGQYTEHEEFRPLEEYVHLIHRAFRMRKEIVAKAIDHLTKHGLKPYQYNAMHVRRNDFQYQDIRHASIERIFNKVKVYIKDEPLLIISDEYNEDLIEMMGRSASRVVMWKCEGRCPPDQLAVDMLAVVPAKRFFGSPLSTFSGGIMQWRNRCRPNTIRQFTVDYTYDIDRLPIWGRPGETRVRAATGSPFHDIGYEKVAVHPEVQKVLEEFYQDDRAEWIDEYVPGEIITSDNGQPTRLKRINQDIIKEKIDVIMRPVLEQWAQVRLAQPKIIYGLRQYMPGAKQKVRASQSDTNVVSAMIVIRADVNKVWPIHVSNRHTGDVGRVVLTVDDMLLYAGRAVEMGMPSPLDGNVVTAFVQYQPENRDDCIVGNCQYCGTPDECSLPEPRPAH